MPSRCFCTDGELLLPRLWSVRRKPGSAKRRKSPASDKTRPAASSQTKSAAPVEEKPVSSSSSRTHADQSRGGSNSPIVQKRREGIGFVRKQPRGPGGPRQSLAVQGELFAERSRPAVTGGGRRAQSAPEAASTAISSSASEPKRKKTVKKKKKKTSRPA